MEKKSNTNLSQSNWSGRYIDCFVTLVLWTWFIFGFILFFSWRYVASAFFSNNTEKIFQKLNSSFFRIFFKILKTVSPRLTIEIHEEVKVINSAIIVCNHLSYLDPLLFLALFQKQKTIVKSSFFKVPIFGWIIRKSGYIPSSSEGDFSRIMINQMENMVEYLQSGGNLFVFPEGTRSRNGSLGNLNKGALKIARICKAPIYVLQLENTDKLYTPGKFFFNSRRQNTIRLQLLDCIKPDYQFSPPTPSQLEKQVWQAFNWKER